MVSALVSYWPIVLTLAGVVGACSKFWLDWLKIREGRLRIRELESRVKKQESLVQTPTPTEVLRFGRKPARRSHFILPSLLVGVVITAATVGYARRMREAASEVDDLTVQHTRADAAHRKALNQLQEAEAALSEGRLANQTLRDSVRGSHDALHSVAGIALELEQDPLEFQLVLSTADEMREAIRAKWIPRLATIRSTAEGAISGNPLPPPLKPSVGLTSPASDVRIGAASEPTQSGNVGSPIVGKSPTTPGVGRDNTSDDLQPTADGPGVAGDWPLDADPIVEVLVRRVRGQLGRLSDNFELRGGIDSDVDWEIDLPEPLRSRLAFGINLDLRRASDSNLVAHVRHRTKTWGFYDDVGERLYIARLQLVRPDGSHEPITSQNVDRVPGLKQALVTGFRIRAHRIKWAGGPAASFGGRGGNPFEIVLHRGWWIESMSITSGSRVNSIAIVYRDPRTSYTVRFGGMGGENFDSIVLDRGDAIRSVSGRADRVVDHLTVVTRHGLRLDGGGRGGNRFVPSLDGKDVIGIRVLAGEVIDRIAFVTD